MKRLIDISIYTAIFICFFIILFIDPTHFNDDESFINDQYNKIMKRNADKSGLEHYTKCLNKNEIILDEQWEVSWRNFNHQ